MFYRIIYRARLFQHTVQKFKAFGLIVQVSRHVLFTHTAQAALALVCQGKVEQFGIFCQTDMPQRIQCTGVQVGGAVLFGLKGAVVKSHGSSKSDSVYHAMKQIDTIVSSGVINDLVAHFEQTAE